RFTVRPSYDLTEPRDGLLVVEGKKLHVNMQSLSAQSSYFNALFFGELKNQSMIEMKEVTFQDMKTLIHLMYDRPDDSINDSNSEHWLKLADRFDLKIVADHVQNSLLAPSSLSIHKKLRLADQFNLEKLKSTILPLYNKQENLVELRNSEEFDKLSSEMKAYMSKKS
ncbi:hypothetical protein PFISCL1PPCAC_11030, partial [Pristionchus fissidentatus]